MELQPSLSPPSYSATIPRAPSAHSLCRGCRQPRREDSEKEPVPGWPTLAKVVTDNPGLEAFPTFRDLNIRSLLYYQAELDRLRKELYEKEWADHTSFQNLGELERLEALNTSENWDHMFESQFEDNTKAQYDLIVEIRKVLKEYSMFPHCFEFKIVDWNVCTDKALIQYSQITAFPKVEPLNVEALRTCLKGKKLVNRGIRGPGADSWGDINSLKTDSQGTHSIGRRFIQLLRSLVWPKKPEENKLDLIVPRSGHAVDGLTRWVASEWISFLVDFRKWRRQRKTSKTARRDPESPIANERHDTTVSHESTTCACKKVYTLNTFSEHRMLQFTSSIATIVACGLPVAAITVLSKLHTNSEVLGIIALFTVAFAGGLMFLSGGTSRIDVFTATAA
jgi:hypothetical protein